MQKINRFRLIADEGKILTDGSTVGYVVDVSEDDVENWSEIDEEKEDENIEEVN